MSPPLQSARSRATSSAGVGSMRGFQSSPEPREPQPRAASPRNRDHEWSAHRARRSVARIARPGGGNLTPACAVAARGLPAGPPRSPPPRAAPCAPRAPRGSWASPSLSKRDSERSASSLPLGLAGGAVVRLVVGVDDALHRRAAHRARLAVLAVHRHLGAKRGDLVGEAVADLGAQPIGPPDQHLLAGRVQAGELVVAERARSGETATASRACRISSLYALPMPSNSDGSVSARLTVWRSLRMRSANAAGLAVRTSSPPRSKSASAGGGQRDAPPMGGADGSTAACPATRWIDARFLPLASVKISVPVGEIERREPDLAGDLGAALLPAQPARDHQVDHDPAHLAVASRARDPDHDALAQPLHRHDAPAHQLGGRWRHRAQHEHARDADALDRLADHARARAARRRP